MDKNIKEYIVTKIEKYDEMREDMAFYESTLKSLINWICLAIFELLYKIHLTGLPEDLDIVVNQILDDVAFFGLVITSYNVLAGNIKLLYAAIMSKIWNNKLQKNDIENQAGTLTIENNEGKTR